MESLLLKMVPKYNAEALSSVPKCMKAAVCLKEKIHVLDELCSAVHCCALDCEFSVNVSVMILNKVPLNSSAYETR